MRRRSYLLTLFFLFFNTHILAQSLSSFEADVIEQDVTYSIRACDDDAINQFTLFLYYSLEQSPTETTPVDHSQSYAGCNTLGTLAPIEHEWKNAPIGLHKSYLRYGTQSDGPVKMTEVCVGPDVVINSFELEKQGANLTYVVKICNEGSMAARKFRVGFWHDESASPAEDDMGKVFKGIVEIPAYSCYDSDGDGKDDLLRVSAGLIPNGDFRAWARIDSGNFVEECREANNTPASIAYTMRNPDLYVHSFDYKVEGSTITYTVKVCNKGALDVPKFFVDIYYDRPLQAPAFGIPGDEAVPVYDLPQQKCETVTFIRSNTPKGKYTSYVIVDSDDFISEPDEANNFSDPKIIDLGGGTTNPNQDSGCIDLDGDQYGVGPQCLGVPDCNDQNAKINPGADEICGDSIDQDCDLTADDGCPGVDCVDHDGDGFGVGKDCVIPDTNDNDKDDYPWAPPTSPGEGKGWVDLDGDGWGVGPGWTDVPDCNDSDPKTHPGVGKEKCGDGIDNDCDYTVDDGCSGVDCVDNDGDGWGVGNDCTMIDPDDSNPDIYPYSDCEDKDKDGFGVGSGCHGIPDADDNDPEVNPKQEEICGDGKDNDGDLTVDDGCPGVSCFDGDGDGFGIGADCVLADCDDTNKDVHPWAVETCGDNKDNNCNGIADDGCQGRQCVDRDSDGFGIGAGCPGPQDCDDNNFFVNPKVKEVCGDGLDNDCDGMPEDGCKDQKVDQDRDGDYAGGGVDGQPDCNDKDATIGPSQLEICGDGIDNDCDGTVDDGCEGVDCVDNDGDGWGVGKDCKIVDCNDSDKTIHPWAKEVCEDSKDNDCDGTVDDGCDGVDCVDKDYDGFGVGADCVIADCDDNDGGRHPWAVERCADDIDNDCNGSIDEGCIVCEDKDGDKHGIGPKCTSWDCNDNDNTSYPGAEEICDLKDNNCDGVVPESETSCALEDDGCQCTTARLSPSHLLIALFIIGWLFMMRRRRES